MSLHLVRATPLLHPRSVTPQFERPSLAIALARALALTLFLALTVLTKLAH